MTANGHEIPAEQLRFQCDPKIFDFECTKDLAPLREFIGQERATRAIEFGLNMDGSGYNIYVAGPTGTGKTSMVKSYIEKIIAGQAQGGAGQDLQDWVYLFNFKEPDRPCIADLPAGSGKPFAEAVSGLLTKVRQGLGQAFSSEEYQKERQNIIEAAQAEQQKLFEQISGEARREGFMLQVTQSGPVLLPLVEDRPMQQEEYLALDEDTRKKLDATQADLRKKLRENLQSAGNVQVKTAERLQQADKEIAEYTVSGLFGELDKTYQKLDKLRQFLTDLKAYVLDNLDLFKGTEEPVNPVLGVPVSQVMGGRNPFVPFQVNVFVDNSEAKGPPVIVEDNPNFGNIFGKVERRFVLGGFLSDHTMLKAGALARADGGYLLLNAADTLANPVVWPALKRAIRNREVRIEEPYEQLGFVAAQGMRPEPMPIKVKIILTGDAMLYQMLSAYDEDFWEIFKVKADFDSEVERTRDNMLAYAAFLSGCCEECQARHFDPTGVAKVIEYSARMVADQERLSSRFAQVKEWIEEANYWADQDKSEHIRAPHVERAMEERYFRHNLVDEKIREMIHRGTIMIDTEGNQVGQLNGLSVYSLGDVSFGRPSRITAKTFLGRGGVINIEREAQMSGPTHNKGVLILSGYLGWKFAQERPLSLSASLCFEQSYGGIDGDSASSTELYAILSDLSGVPIRQGIAVTGSVNQRGEVQPIGGVNQKIEGFFKVCQAKGLTGDQGVMIPALNLKNLMLRQEVVDAVKEGQFHIYSAATIDEGIEILTGVAAGARRKDGSYPADSVNGRVDERLRAMAEHLRDYFAEEKKREDRRDPAGA